MIIDTVSSMFVLLLFGRIVFLFPAVCSWSPKTTRTATILTTTTRTMSTSTSATRKSTVLLGAISRSEIPKHTTQKRKKKKRKKSDNSNNDNNKNSIYDSTSM